MHDGYWPGEKECAALNWVLTFGDDVMPDLNRLVMEGQWNREYGRWEPRQDAPHGTVDMAMEWYVPGGIAVKTTEFRLPGRSAHRQPRLRAGAGCAVIDPSCVAIVRCVESWWIFHSSSDRAWIDRSGTTTVEPSQCRCAGIGRSVATFSA